MELHPETKSRYLKQLANNNLILVENKKFAYSERMIKNNQSRTEHDVHGMYWFNKNIIWSGTSCKELNNNREINEQLPIPDKFTNHLGNGIIDEYLEIYNTEEDLNTRKTQLGLSAGWRADSDFYSLEEAKGMGKHNPTSHLPFADCPNNETREQRIIEKNGVARIYKINDSTGSIKYGLRWMIKL